MKTSTLKNRLDRLIQELYVPLNPRCLVCGEKTSCMHHFIQKKQSLYLRWDKRNLVPLCRRCHCLHHISGDPYIHQTILKVKGHKWADKLQEDRRKIFKDTLENLKRIEALLKIKKVLNGS